MLELRQVTWSDGGIRALHDVTLRIPRHLVYGIVGPIGSGKSTLLDLLSGFKAPAAGTIALDGVRLEGPPHRAARRGLARTHAPPRLFERSTAREHALIAQHRRGRGRLWQELLFNAETRREGVERRERAAALLALTGLEQVADREARTLDAGARQRLAIAVALAQGPDYLLLDEPTVGMDGDERRAFLSLLLEIVQTGITIVLAERDADLALRACDRLAVLRAGALLVEGPTRDVQVDPALQAAYGEGESQ